VEHADRAGRRRAAHNGEYRVVLDVVATKQRPGSAGEETEVPMDDIGDIGAFSSSQSEPLYLKQRSPSP
jgi:hypothetical protein